MDIVVLKFGGSSVANNINLNIVANKIIQFKQYGKSVIVVVSAQGKTTDNLIKEAKELSEIPSPRELDALLNVGEQISASKLAILLNKLGYDSISLNGYQAGIKTTGEFQNAKIIDINIEKIKAELSKNKIVIITGFQGVDEQGNITTLGRGGSDTSAVAIASVLKAKKCYIFSDVDGVYTSDPKHVKNALKLKNISYKEMKYASNEGAKVLHDRCVELAEKYNLPIIAASTFSDNEGTKITKEIQKKKKSLINNKGIEESEIKSIIKNDNILLVTINSKESSRILKEIIRSNIRIGNYQVYNNSVKFTIMKDNKEKLINLFGRKGYKVNIIEVTKISIVGIGISSNNKILNTLVNILTDIKDEISYIDINACKISIQFKSVIDNKYLSEIHNNLFKYYNHKSYLKWI